MKSKKIFSFFKAVNGYAVPVDQEFRAGIPVTVFCFAGFPCGPLRVYPDALFLYNKESTLSAALPAQSGQPFCLSLPLREGSAKSGPFPVWPSFLRKRRFASHRAAESKRDASAKRKFEKV